MKKRKWWGLEKSTFNFMFDSFIKECLNLICNRHYDNRNGLIIIFNEEVHPFQIKRMKEFLETLTIKEISKIHLNFPNNTFYSDLIINY